MDYLWLLLPLGAAAGYALKSRPIIRPTLYLKARPPGVCEVASYHYPDGSVIEQHTKCADFPSPGDVPDGWTHKKSGGHEI